jgi:hypothetical protein
MRGDSGTRCESGSSSSRSNCTGTRPGCWSSAAMRSSGGSATGRANRRRSTSWGSRSSAAARGAGHSCFKRHTRRDRMRAAAGRIKDEMRRRRHDSLAEQGRWLRAVVAGYFAYHAVPTNAAGDRGVPAPRPGPVAALAEAAQSEGPHDVGADGPTRREWLPHPMCFTRGRRASMAVRYPRWEPYALIGHVRICAGGAQQWAPGSWCTASAGCIAGPGR